MNSREVRKTELWSLLRAIATGDTTRASHLLAEFPELASEASRVGATRSSSTPYFVEEIGHHIYVGDTALHVAAAAYRTEMAKKLIANGANVSANNRRGAQPLHYASVGQPGSTTWAPKSQAAVVTLLLNAGADPNAVDNSGVTPLHKAVRTRCTAAVRVLLAHGADPRRKNGSGSTPLHLAVHNTGRTGSGSTASAEEQRKIIHLLMEHGARPDGRDAERVGQIQSSF
ncbi:MAG: ankyrin repeat domain-containing protein [Gemmatimonadaceae bacterium]